MIRVVIFDLDGTIVDTEPIWFQTFKEILKEYGHEYTEEIRRLMMGRSNASLVLKEIFNIKEDVEVLREKIRSKYKSLVMENLVLMPGFYNLLEKLEGKLRLAVASGSPADIANLVIDKLDLRQHFSFIVCGDQVRNGKPDPEIFLSVSKKLKVKSAHCVVIEDSPKGVNAAKNAGMKCIAVRSPYVLQEDISKADLIVNNLLEINLEKIRSLNEK